MSKKPSATDPRPVEGFDPSQIKKLADIVLPTLSIKNMKEGDVLYTVFESGIKFVEQTDEKTGKVKMKKDTDPPEPELLPLVIATNMITGERGQLVIPAIPLRGLQEIGDLVGRKFMFTKGRSLGTAKANLWEVAEFE